MEAQSPTDLSPEVESALNEYLELIESGSLSDQLQWKSRHSDLMPQLEPFLEGLRLLQQHSLPLRADAAAVLDDVAPESTQKRLGDFQLLHQIGRGGMGVVYEAEQLSLHRRVAVKVLPFAGAFDSTLRQRFELEAQAAAQLHHPHIVPVFTVGCERGIHFYAMQLIRGSSVAALIEQLRHGRSDNSIPQSVREASWFQKVARFGVQTAQGLQYAHGQGIVHRDIKPANLLINEKEDLFITDFGLASTREATGLTASGHITGTLRYASPEQIQGGKTNVDARTDIYSLGSTLYELLTLSPPFPGDDHRALTHSILHSTPPAPRLVNPDIPKDLETVVLKAISAERTDRYESAESLAEDLMRFLNGSPVRARRVSRGERFFRLLLRRPSVTVGFLTIPAILIAAITLSVVLLRQTDPLVSVFQQLATSDSADVLTADLPNYRQKAERQRRAMDYAENVALADWMLHHFQTREAMDLLDRWIPAENRRLSDGTSAESSETDLRGFEWYYLRNYPDPGEIQLTGHSQAVYNIAWSRDGKRLASASQDTTVRLWEMDFLNGRLNSLDPGQHPAPTARILAGHEDEAGGVAFSFDGRKLASTSDDGTIRVWELDGTDTSRVLRGHNCSVVCAAFSPLTGHLVSADDHGRLFVWNPESGELLNQIQGHQSDPEFRRNHDDEQHSVNRGRVQCIEFTPDGSQLATSGDDTFVRIWDTRRLPELTERLTLGGHRQSVHCVSWSSDGRKIVSGGWDKTIRIREEGEPHVLRQFATCPDQLQSVTFSSHDRHITGTTNTSTIHQFDVMSGDAVDTILIPGIRCWCAKYSPGNQWLATSGDTLDIRIWPGDPSARLRRKTVATKSPVVETLISDDGRHLVTVDRSGRLSLRSVLTGEETQELPGKFSSSKPSLAVIPGGRIAASNVSGALEIWNLSSDTPQKLSTDQNSTYAYASVSRDGRLISRYNQIPWNLITGKPETSWQRASEMPCCVIFGFNKDCHAASSHDQGHWWIPKTGQQIPTKYLMYHDLIAFSPDGKTVFSGTPKGLIYELEVGKPEPVRIRMRCEGELHQLLVSPDGRTLASASQDGKLTLWNIATGLKLLSISHPQEPVLSAAFLPDDKGLLYSTADSADDKNGGTLHIIRLP
jgi:WD40 repeat protein